MKTKQEIQTEEIEKKTQELSRLEAEKARKTSLYEKEIAGLDEEIEAAKFRKEAVGNLKV